MISACMIMDWAVNFINISDPYIHTVHTGCLSVTNTHPIGKLDIPVHEWPIAPFPKMKYPLKVSEL